MNSTHQELVNRFKDSSLLPFVPSSTNCTHSYMLVDEWAILNCPTSGCIMILHGRHPVTKLIIEVEHLCLMRPSPTLLIFSLSQKFNIIGLRRRVRFINKQCITCKHHSVKHQNQLFGQLPLERITPASLFEKVGVDCAGPFHVRYTHVRKPTIVKAYICVFSRESCPSGIWPDYWRIYWGTTCMSIYC